MQKVSELPYERVDGKEVVKRINECTQKAKLALSGEELVKLREECLKPISRFSTMANLAFTRFTLNTRDEFYCAEKDYYDETFPKVDAEFVKFKRAFTENAHIKEAAKFVNPLVIKQYELSAKCTNDKTVPLRVEENKIVTEYSKLMAETLYEYNGQKIPLASLRKYMADTNRNVRKAAYETLGKTLEAISDKLDDIFDRLVKVRTATAKALGYENFVELGDNLMGRISYNRDMLRAFRQNVKSDIVPAVAKLKTQLGKKLGINKFMLYDNDTYFENGNPAPVLNAQEMFEAANKMYHDMSGETGEFFDMMLKSEAFDVFPREGKWGGGYCEQFTDFKQPFILANFNGTSGDVDVLTHEAGHAFASYMSFVLEHDQDISLGMETAETHSMGMEFFCYKYMKDFFGDRADDYKHYHFFDAINFIPYGTIVDYFQELVYQNPEMTPAERNALWNRLEKEFRPWLNSDGIPYLEKGTRWQYQAHIFENPFYYIDYCLAQSVAVQFYFASRKDYSSAFEAYARFVKHGSQKEFPALVSEAGLCSPFENGALKEIAANAVKIIGG